MKINWDVVKVLGGGLFVAGGPLAGVLAAFGVADGTISKWLGIGIAVLSLICFIGPLLAQALQRTDAGKARDIASLSPAGQAAVLDKLPDETKIAAVNAIPAVTQVVVSDFAVDGAAKAVADRSLKKVVSETQASQVHL